MNKITALINQYRKKVRLSLMITICAGILLSCGNNTGTSKSDEGANNAEIYVSAEQGHQADSLAKSLAKTVMATWKAPVTDHQRAFRNWTYEQGVILKGFENLWTLTGNPVYFKYIQNSIDYFVDQQGGIRSYDASKNRLDDINNGNVLLTLAADLANAWLDPRIRVS